MPLVPSGQHPESGQNALVIKYCRLDPRGDFGLDLPTCRLSNRHHLMLPGLQLARHGTDQGAPRGGQGAGEEAHGCLRVSAAAGLAGGPARAQAPSALPLDARLSGIPDSGSADL